jgi:hypothetical protein
MAQFFVGIWRALTATGRLFFLGATEAWGFWLTTIPLLLVVLFAATICNGITWRLIEGRLHPKMRDKEMEAKFREEIARLKIEVYDATKQNEKLGGENGNLRGLVREARNHWINWNVAARRETK